MLRCKSASNVFQHERPQAVADALCVYAHTHKIMMMAVDNEIVAGRHQICRVLASTLGRLDPFAQVELVFYDAYGRPTSPFTCEIVDEAKEVE